MYGARSETIVPHSSKLKKESPLMGFVYRVLNQELIKVSAAIETAHRNNKDNVTIKLTFNFNCPDYVNNADVQKNVFFKVITDLEQKGYGVKLKVTSKEALLYVTWKVHIDQEKIERMEDKIRSVMI